MYSNFNQKVWYTPQSQKDEQKPVRFLIQTIPYRFTSLAIARVNTNSLVVNDFLKEHCILDFQNIITDIPKNDFIQDLEIYIGKEMFDDVINKILELWSPDSKFLSTLVTTIEIMLDPRFGDGTWNCRTCQERGLDKQRNCPLIEGTDHLDAMFKLPFMDETITECPVSGKDERLGQLLLEGYNFREINQLPEAGGMGDQPIIFVTGTQYLAERLNYFKRQAEEESLRKAGH